MATCEICGNGYDRPLRIEYDGKTMEFDCFECAIHKLAPTCATCGVRVLGHGHQWDESLYCCAHCAKRAGAKGLADRV